MFFQVAAVQLLLDLGADVNDTGRIADDGSCLHIATQLNRHKMIKLLLDNGADTALKNSAGELSSWC